MFFCLLNCDIIVLICASAARKESAKEKQLKEEEKILESVAEGRGKMKTTSSSSDTKLTKIKKQTEIQNILKLKKK